MKRYAYIGCTIAYASLIFYLSSQSSPPNPKMLVSLYSTLKSFGFDFLAYPFYFAYRYPDKFCHMVLYMGFGFVLYQAIKNTMSKYQTVISMIIGTLYTVFDEIHQLMVPQRTASMGDLFADVVGLTISQIFIGIGRRFL